MNRNRRPRTASARERMQAEIQLEREVAARKERNEISASTAKFEERLWALEGDYDYIA